MKAFDWLFGIALILCIGWGVGETSTSIIKQKHSCLDKRQSKTPPRYSLPKARVTDDYNRGSWVVVRSSATQATEEDEEETETETGDSAFEEPTALVSNPIQSERLSCYASSFSDSEDRETKVYSGQRSISYAQNYDTEISEKLDDFVGAVEPRRGQTIKTGSTAFREDGDMVVVTGSTIHTSRGMWVDTGGVILGPQGQSMLRVGGFIYENGEIISQKIGGSDGDYYLRNGYSINQNSQTLTDFNSR